MSIATATKYLKSFYSNVFSDFASLQDIYVASNRNLSNPKNNRAWLGNKLIYMKRHGLVEPVYDGVPLTGLKLTEVGKKALGRAVENSTVVATNGHSKTIDQQTIMEMVARLQEQNPKFEIKFEMRLKSGYGVA